ncbi:MAG TPA: glycosyltransferase family 2 protein [Gemmatimonadales bacterium]|nr:glycosyltransferase family 2 protein [Gemmatimonadales bacterium]
MSLPALTIVLSTYNGARFLAEQIESIRQQTFTDWMLLLRDDGSVDETRVIVDSLEALDSRIVVVRDQLGNLGPVGSYGVLLQHAADRGARYVALADQDDVWQADKLAQELELIRDRERVIGESVPLLVHTDLTVVREDLSVVHPSFLDFQRLSHVTQDQLSRLLMQNFVTGCTTVINRALLEAALPFPKVVFMHDWWLALCAATLGEVLYLPRATVLYRQHGGNALGCRGWAANMLDTVRRPVVWWLSSGEHLDLVVAQAKELMRLMEREDRLETPTTRRSLGLLREFCSAFAQGNAVDRLMAIYRHRIKPRTFLPWPLRYYLRVLLWSPRMA